ncbi:unnamed protein product [Mytilus edulis]|uniref:Uncharacterized protein n=1 Tax=Mytilus edulis TaxID=6550 RepID=A0A8S3UVI6_MYTED|nr:unnamed protein product [Mytilus edulis]
MAQERERQSKGHWKTLSNKYKQMEQGETISKGHWKPLSNKYKTNGTREREYQRVIGNPLSNKYKQMAQERETISKVIGNPCPINTNKWVIIGNPLSNKYKQMAQEERQQSQHGNLLCPTIQTMEQKRKTKTSKWSLKTPSYSINNKWRPRGETTSRSLKTHPTTQRNGTRERQYQRVIGNFVQ